MEPRVGDRRALAGGFLDGAVDLLPINPSRDRVANLGAETGSQAVQFFTRFILQVCNLAIEIGGKGVQVGTTFLVSGAVALEEAAPIRLQGVNRFLLMVWVSFLRPAFLSCFRDAAVGSELPLGLEAPGRKKDGSPPLLPMKKGNGGRWKA
jgi:hypothetical protein